MDQWIQRSIIYFINCFDQKINGSSNNSFNQLIESKNQERKDIQKNRNGYSQALLRKLEKKSNVKLTIYDFDEKIIVIEQWILIFL